jgi:two-component sensor histidine kinase
VIRDAVEARLFALSRSHNLLTRENWHSAGLLDILHDALEPFGVTDGRAERLVITGENIRLSTRAALALGIAFNELATNAVKYGAFSNDKGSIRIDWTIEPTPEGRRLVLSWQEKDGPQVTPPAAKRVRLACDRARTYPRARWRCATRLSPGGVDLHDEHSGTGNS